MWEKIRDHWVKLAAAGVVLVIAAVCLAKHFAVDDGPQYSQTTTGACAGLPYDLLSPVFGQTAKDVLISEEPGSATAACAMDYAGPPPNTRLTVRIWLLASTGEAETQYSSVRASLVSVNTWKLDLAVRDAEWASGRFVARASVLDGNAVITVEMPGNQGGAIDLRIQEPLTKLLKALLDNLRKEDQDVI
jgi:hypothetical protein